MTGLYLHPLRLKALSEGRLSVLRVPMTNLGNVKLVERADPADWNAGRAHPNMRRFEEWKDKDAGALFFVDTGSVVFVPAPYAPGDYFVKEKLFAECYASKSWNDLTYEDGEEVLAEIPVDWCPPINAVRTHWESGDNIPQGGFEWYTATVASMFMPEWAARYVLTLGPPVPGRLGDVDVSSMQQEGIFASLMQDPCDMAKQIKGKYRDEWNTIYPGHPWHPGLWTWAYPVRRKR